MEVADPISLALALSLPQSAPPLPVPAMATAMEPTTEQGLSLPEPQNLYPIPLPVPAMAKPQNPNPLPIPATATPTTRHRFVTQPHPLELVEVYLRPRVVSNLRVDFIHELDPYAATPDDLAEIHDPTMAGDGPAWYYFSRLRAKKGGRTDRSVIAGSGWSWHQDRRPKSIYSGTTKVGNQLTLSYSRLKEGQSRSRERSGWMMSEYSLYPATEGQPVIVLCKIYHLRVREEDSDNDKGKGAYTSTSTSTSPPGTAAPAPRVSTSPPGTAAPARRVSTSPLPCVEFCHPSDSDLLVKFLLPVLSCNVLVHHVSDMYKLPPADLVKDFKSTTSSDGNEMWYFFASASVDSAVRVVAGGVGCWESVHATSDVLGVDKYKLGQRKLFRFRRYDGVEHILDGWHMIELTRNKDVAGTEAFVLCKVYHTRAGIKRIHFDSPIHSCLGLKKAALGVTAGQPLVM